MHEEHWVIEIRNGILRITDPAGKSAQLTFDEIKGIAIETNDSGPWGTDVVWHITDGEATIDFPMGATGETEVVNELMKIEGFENQEVINAMGSVDNNVFIPLDRTKA